MPPYRKAVKRKRYITKYFLPLPFNNSLRGCIIFLFSPFCSTKPSRLFFSSNDTSNLLGMQYFYFFHVSEVFFLSGTRGEPACPEASGEDSRLSLQVCA